MPIHSAADSSSAPTSSSSSGIDLLAETWHPPQTGKAGFEVVVADCRSRAASCSGVTLAVRTMLLTSAASSSLNPPFQTFDAVVEAFDAPFLLFFRERAQFVDFSLIKLLRFFLKAARIRQDTAASRTSECLHI